MWHVGRLRKHRENARDDVENKKWDVPEIVFDIIAEAPEIGHVADQVQPAAMQEHGGEKGRKIRYRIGEKFARGKRPFLHKAVALVQLEKESRHIRDDEKI